MFWKEMEYKQTKIISQYIFFLKLLFLSSKDYSYLRLFAKVATKFSNVLEHSHIILSAVIPKLAC